MDMLQPVSITLLFLMVDSKWLPTWLTKKVTNLLLSSRAKLATLKTTFLPTTEVATSRIV